MIEDQNARIAIKELDESEDDEEIEGEGDNKSMSESSNPSAKMVGRMISQARKVVAIGSSSTIGGPEDSVD